VITNLRQGISSDISGSYRQTIIFI